MTPFQHEINELTRSADGLREQIKRLKSTNHADVTRLNRQQEELAAAREREKALKAETAVRQDPKATLL